MRVGFLTSWGERCGIAEYSRLLLHALAERPDHPEVEVVPATFRHSPKPVYGAMGQALNGGDVTHVQHSYAFFGGMHPLRSGWGALLHEIRRPLLLTVHELDLRPTGAYQLPPALETAYKRWFNQSSFLHPRVSRWLVHAEPLRDALIELGAPAEKVYYRPLPLEPPQIAPDPGLARERFKLTGKKVLVLLGFLSRRKGYDVALQALAALPPEYVLVAAGGEHAADRSDTAAWLRAEAERLGVAERFRVTGFLSEEELEAVTSAADGVLAPFHEMSASASLGYAIARGKPVIATDLPEIRTLDCVRRVPRADTAALANAVREVLDSPTLRRELAERCAHYTREHSYAGLAEWTMRIYSELSDEGSRDS